MGTMTPQHRVRGTIPPMENGLKPSSRQPLRQVQHKSMMHPSLGYTQAYQAHIKADTLEPFQTSKQVQLKASVTAYPPV